MARAAGQFADLRKRMNRSRSKAFSYPRRTPVVKITDKEHSRFDELDIRSSRLLSFSFRRNDETTISSTPGSRSEHRRTISASPLSTCVLHKICLAICVPSAGREISRGSTRARISDLSITVTAVSVASTNHGSLKRLNSPRPTEGIHLSGRIRDINVG